MLRLPDGTAVHGAPPPDEGPRAARRGGARHRLRDEAHRRRLRVARHDAQARRLPARALPEHLRARAWRSASTSRREPIPVVPAAHYMCGGVRGRPRRAHHAAGPVGGRRGRLHGPARRQPPGLQLAARGPGVRPPRRGRAAPSDRRPICRSSEPPDWDPGKATRSDEAVVVTHNWDELRRFMWNYVGHRALRPAPACAPRAASRCCKEEIREYYFRHFVTRDLLELRNIADVAELIITQRAFRRRAAACTTTSTTPRRRPASAPTPCCAGARCPHAAACRPDECASGADYRREAADVR